MSVNIPGNGRVSITGKMKIGPTFSPITATGGTINDVTVNNVTYRTHTFTSTGILTVTSAENNIATVEYLVVGGGAGGGSARHVTGPSGRSGGGGGAGGYRTGTLNLNTGDYDIAVGAGGTGGTNNSSANASADPGTPGGPSKLSFGGGGSCLLYTSDAADE